MNYDLTISVALIPKYHCSDVNLFLSQPLYLQSYDNCIRNHLLIIPRRLLTHQRTRSQTIGDDQNPKRQHDHYRIDLYNHDLRIQSFKNFIRDTRKKNNSDL